jgi:hypothetical protein
MQIIKINKIKINSHTYLKFTLDSHKLDLGEHTNLHPIIYFEVVSKSRIEMSFFLGIPKRIPKIKTIMFQIFEIS